VAISPVGSHNKRRRAMLEVHASQLVPYTGEYQEPDVLLDNEDLEGQQREE
jgi:hypothetical protein